MRKYLKVLIPYTGIFYIVGVFITMKFDPNDWTIETRAITTFLWAIIGALFVLPEVDNIIKKFKE